MSGFRLLVSLSFVDHYSCTLSGRFCTEAQINTDHVKVIPARFVQDPTRSRHVGWRLVISLTDSSVLPARSDIHHRAVSMNHPDSTRIDHNVELRNWSRVLSRLSMQWSISALIVLLSSLQTAFAWQDGEQTPSAKLELSLEKQQLAELEALEKAVTKELTSDVNSGELQKTVLSEVNEVRDPSQRAVLLKRLTRLFSAKGDSSLAREAALSIDQSNLLDRVRGMVILADAERSQNNNTEAWWSLREAQHLAMQLERTEDVIAVFREIGTVEKKLKTTGLPDESMQLNPAPQEVISEVLDHGLPQKGYHEIEFLREGGGPLREPVVFRHSYYYDGDRYYQGPNFSGGDTQVRVMHPRTGCEVSIPLKMPAGAPVIVHDSREIEYLYPEVTVEIRFQNDGAYEVDYDRRDWKYSRLRKRLEKQKLADNPFADGDNSAIRSVKAAAQRGLSGPVTIGRRLPIFSGLLEETSSRIPGTLSAPSP